VKLFIALWPDEPVRAALAADLPALARAAGGRATAPANLHLTVAFIGQVDERRFADIAALLAATRPAPLTLVLDRLGAFVSQRVLFRAPSRFTPELLAAQQELVTALAAQGVPVDRRPFRPHVTLARRCERAVLTALAVGGEPTRPVVWHAPGWALVESRSSTAGVIYHPRIVL
jgi:2'-5' RNA ligase